MTTTEWIKKYETYLLVVKSCAVNTIRAYSKDVELLQKFSSCEDWAAFDEGMAAQYVRYLKESGKESSVQRKVYSLKHFFRFLRKERAILANPFDDFQCRAAQRKLPEHLTIQEMQTVLNKIRQPLPVFLGVPSEDVFLTIRDRAMLEAMYSTGARVKEVAGLNWMDIDYHKREAKIVKGKGGKQRLVPLGQKALDALLEYGRHYETWWEKKPEGTYPLFLSTWDRRIETRSIWRVVRRWCDRAGVRRVSPHAFRHSCATHMIERGADIRIVQEMLGHASLSTTQIYIHVATQQVRSVHANTHPRG